MSVTEYKAQLKNQLKEKRIEETKEKIKQLQDDLTRIQHSHTKEVLENQIRILQYTIHYMEK